MTTLTPMAPRLRTQIKARLAELAPIAEEFDQLERMLGALRHINRRRPSTRLPRRRGRRYPARRAPRGQNRQAINAALYERPMTAAELAERTGIARATLASTLSQQKAKGLLQNDGGAWALTPAGVRDVEDRRAQA